ncbi:hypothetical protein CkaCkLH20_04405 [Colletotrichum karsti]|uniref:Wac domain-containing protein n=1 Tax=Colletotrichum karsti TaxID=1095194 RepID=A0A9P6I7K4_9PEZI|nr:uncharacterized protein CkaCkLH20_04405 [Colletotrichum karsti]KAF9878367.1 hypothetical protein CkaCkLH20_04405 [Colletotrichum karsti]
MATYTLTTMRSPNPALPLTRNEFVDARNKQDKQLNDEFRSIRTTVTSLTSTVTSLTLEVKRLDAYTRNNNLQNPTLPIIPVPRWDEDLGIDFPPRNIFPRHAKQLYALRRLSGCSETTARRRKDMLASLVKFYDVEYAAWELEGQDDYDYNAYDSDSDSEVDADSDHARRPPPALTLEDAVYKHPDRAVEALERILGLNEENFINFRERAAALRHISPAQPAKREYAPYRVDHERTTPPSKRVTRPIVGRAPQKTIVEELYPEEDDGAGAGEEEGSGHTKITWADSGKLRKQQKTRELQEAARDAISNDGSSTNAETLSRELNSPRRPRSPV